MEASPQSPTTTDPRLRRLCEILGYSPEPVSPPALPLRFAVDEVYRSGSRTVVSGQLLSGTVKTGDPLVFSPTHKTSTVAAIERRDGAAVETAVAGEEVRLLLGDHIGVQPGHIASHEQDAPIESNRLKARLAWDGPAPLRLRELACLHLGPQRVDAEIVAIDHPLDAATGQPLPESDSLPPGSIAEVTMQTRGVLVLDNFDRNPALGHFQLLAGDAATPSPSTGAGLIVGGHYLDRAQVKSENIFWSESNVTAQQRARRNGHKGAVVWLTGLSGSGKSTISRALERELFELGLHVYVLDGDNVRHGLNSNLGFSPEDRVENIRRIGEVAKLISDAGIIVVTAFISPYRDDRRRAREIALEAGGEFIEVFVDAPLEVCEQRDVKGLYRRARAGEIKEFTGISAPYEAPSDPEVTVQTDLLTREEAVQRIIAFLRPRLAFE